MKVKKYMKHKYHLLPLFHISLRLFIWAIDEFQFEFINTPLGFFNYI